MLASKGFGVVRIPGASLGFLGIPRFGPENCRIPARKVGAGRGVRFPLFPAQIGSIRRQSWSPEPTYEGSARTAEQRSCTPCSMSFPACQVIDTLGGSEAGQSGSNRTGEWVVPGASLLPHAVVPDNPIRVVYCSNRARSVTYQTSTSEYTPCSPANDRVPCSSSTPSPGPS